jgi:hypothetical protein
MEIESFFEVIFNHVTEAMIEFIDQISDFVTEKEENFCPMLILSFFQYLPPSIEN